MDIEYDDQITVQIAIKLLKKNEWQQKEPLMKNNCFYIKILLLKIFKA